MESDKQTLHGRCGFLLGTGVEIVDAEHEFSVQPVPGDGAVLLQDRG